MTSLLYDVIHRRRDVRGQFTGAPVAPEVLDRILADCTPQERYAMTVKNVVDLYGLPFEV